jgi:tRNA threonylcarbamoyladenosine biosynthesis protein TsaB
MTILALEFSSAQRSVAIARGGEVLAAASETGERGTKAFGLIENVLAAAKIGREEIQILAAGLGPGSYTGIRVALSIARGWQLARGVKLLGIGSAECLAAQAQAEKMSGRVNVVIDAQRGEFYLATCEILAAGLEEVAPLKIVTATEVKSRADAGEILIGPEVTRWFPSGKTLFPTATMLAKLAARRTDFSAGGSLEPIYLRTTSFVKTSLAKVSHVNQTA